MIPEDIIERHSDELEETRMNREPPVTRSEEEAPITTSSQEEDHIILEDKLKYERSKEQSDTEIVLPSISIDAVLTNSYASAIQGTNDLVIIQENEEILTSPTSSLLTSPSARALSPSPRSRSSSIRSPRGPRSSIQSPNDVRSIKQVLPKTIERPPQSNKKELLVFFITF